MPAIRTPTRLPRSQRIEQLRDDILDKAIRLFARQGYPDTDLQVLADQVGVGKGTLYRHFGNKQALFLAAADRVMRSLRRHVDDRIAGVDEPLERITAAIRAYLEYFHEHPEAVEMLIQERAQFRDRKRPTYFEHREANIERWRTLYRDLIAAGRVRNLPLDRITDHLGDLLYGTMFVNYIAGRNRPPADAARDLTDIVFHGILTDSERQRRNRKP
jgi:AcrR family transcriptional regulator